MILHMKVSLLLHHFYGSAEDYCVTGFEPQSEEVMNKTYDDWLIKAGFVIKMFLFQDSKLIIKRKKKKLK